MNEMFVHVRRDAGDGDVVDELIRIDTIRKIYIEFPDKTDIVFETELGADTQYRFREHFKTEPDCWNRFNRLCHILTGQSAI